MSSAKQNLARAQREEYTWWQWKRWKSKEESSLLFFSRTVMKYCSGPSVPLHAASGQSRQLGDSRFLSGDKNKMSATLWAGLLCCVPGPLTRCQLDTWCQLASSSNRCSAGDSCSLADWNLGTWRGVAVCVQTQSLQCHASGQRLRHACHNTYPSFCSVPYCHTNIIALWDTSLVSCDLGMEMETCTMGTAALTGRTSSKLSLGYISDPVCKQAKSLGSFKSVGHMT